MLESPVEDTENENFLNSKYVGAYLKLKLRTWNFKYVLSVLSKLLRT